MSDTLLDLALDVSPQYLQYLEGGANESILKKFKSDYNLEEDHPILVMLGKNNGQSVSISGGAILGCRYLSDEQVREAILILSQIEMRGFAGHQITSVGGEGQEILPFLSYDGSGYLAFFGKVLDPSIISIDLDLRKITPISESTDEFIKMLKSKYNEGELKTEFDDTGGVVAFRLLYRGEEAFLPEIPSFEKWISD